MSAVYVFFKLSEITNALKAYETTVENQKIFKMQRLRLDQAGEQIGKHFKDYAHEQEISI